MARRNNLWANIDWFTILLYLVLVFLGWINIYASVYNEEHQNILDFSQRYGKQLIFIAAAMLIGLIILLIESNFYVFFSYIIYGVVVLLLILVTIFGNEINGAKSWFTFGSFGFQPSEFAKFATGLALARYMSTFGFKIQRLNSILTISTIILVPVLIIVLQNDTGSALVYSAFILVLYREGLSGIVLFFALLIVILFLLTLVLSNTLLVAILTGTAVVAYFIFNTSVKQFFMVFAFYVLAAGFVFGVDTVFNFKLHLSNVFIIGAVVASIAVVIGFRRKKNSRYLTIATILLGALLLTTTVNFIYDQVLEPYHQARINELLGLQSDPLGAGYNVNQSKIAIGSGGFWGKGFLNGTQTKFDFVPEQSTDFIFCTVGEEWGFVGTFVVVVLFLVLLSRIIILAERQRSGFSRIYGYSVAVIFFFHFMVNIGMTIGIMPVIGIPLPFFSYGGSSLWSFSILLFIFLRLDASRLEHISE